MDWLSRGFEVTRLRGVLTCAACTMLHGLSIDEQVADHHPVLIACIPLDDAVGHRPLHRLKVYVDRCAGFYGPLAERLIGPTRKTLNSV